MTDLTPDLVLAKTSKGTREIAERLFGLDLRLRRALILVDGKTSLGELMRRAAGIPDFVETLRTLVEHGFVAPVDDRFESADGARTRPLMPDGAPQAGARTPQEQVVELARQLLGEHAERVVSRIESGGAGAVELGISVDACYKLIRLTIDEKKAEDFLRRARRILSTG
ncbi:MAG: hypothetical protein ACK4V1_02225 [Burkholderiaceae bacterium]